MPDHPPAPAARIKGFTLVELLVVIGIIAVLMGILLPALAAARQRTHLVTCLSNLRQVGIAVHSYANDNGGRIPFGPDALPYASAGNFYPFRGSPTSLLSLDTGAPVGIGLVLERYLRANAMVVFCPGADQPYGLEQELTKIGKSQAQGSFYYRHASVVSIADPVATGGAPAHIALRRLGTNRNGKPVRALAMDSQFLAPVALSSFNIFSRTHHSAKWSNVLFSDGSAAASKNTDGRFTVNVNSPIALPTAFDLILKAFERADVE